ncbi:hypothetical protein TanjilG_09019 [Lupinus angustifolius]|uniref:Glabrous enhancer-binding protein-like DBD domain-containing protein n=1 Tax=Lupinus angustifolius TaxID=3871 RepID=A0A4P1QPD7_LUPAN|nr:PREDICTED: GLABROUS1 enhancer-binding protein-like [Lupinus angustifolius]OIV91607.1 hypothetical protein TanjilG_09019 [Lupinus angustifolius]
MAQKQKRPSPHDVPPSVSSDDEPIPSSQPESEKEEEEDRDEQPSSEEEEEDDDEEEEKTQPQSKNPKSADSSESVTDSDSGSESESESRDASNYQIQPKPLALKPVDETPVKVNSKSSKRPVESNGSGDASRAKKKKVTDAAAAAVAASSENSDDEDDDDDDGDGDGKAAEVKKSSGAVSDSKSIPFQRLFSEEDEIAILNGMIEFKKTTGNDPFRFINFFHRFVSKSLHIDASSNQLKDKIQRLKRKFNANAKKKSFSKRHDEEAFELSKKIWGNAGGSNEIVEKAKSNGKALKSAMKEGSKGNDVPLKSKPEPKQEVKSLMDSKDSKEEAVNMETVEKTDIPLSIAQGFGSYGLNENMTKKALDLMGASDRAKLEKQWKEFEAAEFEASVKRLELVAKHARLIWEAYEASNH